MRPSLFSDVRQRLLEVGYGLTGADCRYRLQGPSGPWVIGQMGCLETSVTSYQHAPPNIPEERRPLLGRSYCGIEAEQ